MPRTCSCCQIIKEKECFSKSQWSRTPITSSCMDCNGESPPAAIRSSASKCKIKSNTFNENEWNEYDPNIEELKNYPKGLNFFEMIAANKALYSLHINNTDILLKKLKSQPPNQTEADIQQLYQLVIKQIKELNEQLAFATNANQTIINSVMTCIAEKSLSSMPNFAGVPFALSINAMLVLANMWRDYTDEITNACFKLKNFDRI